jgi:DNA-binding NarL/FixJ family response regulator
MPLAEPRIPLQLQPSVSILDMRIVIVEDHGLTRDLLTLLCQRDLHHEIVGEASDGPQAVEVIVRCKPDLVLLDLHLPEFCGFGVVETIRRAGCRPRILALSSHCDDYTVYCIEHAKFDGFVDKLASLVINLQDAIAMVAQGRSYFSNSYYKIKAARHMNPEAFDKILTTREQRILSMIGDFLTDDEIAGRLTISDMTVEKHRGNMLHKLGLENRAALVRYAHEHGFTQAVGFDALASGQLR